MSRPPDVRATDDDRERAVALLQHAAGEGQLDLDELAGRVEQAHGARTLRELRALTADLQRPRGLAPTPAATAAAPRELALCTGLRRRGRWQVPEQGHFVALLGSVDLDLRQAVLAAPLVELRLVCVLGSITVRVPEGVQVEVVGGPLLGGRDLRLDGPPPPAGAPTVRIVAGGALGSLRVRCQPRLREQLQDVAREVLERVVERTLPPRNAR